VEAACKVISARERHSLVEIMGGAADEVVARQWFDALGFDENDIVDILHAAFDEEEGFLGDKQALLVE
jgi:hypothetical protein